MQQPDGKFMSLTEDEAGALQRIGEAGKRELPIFFVGEIIPLRSGDFRVLALDGHLLVLQGVPKDEAETWYAQRVKMIAERCVSELREDAK